MSLPTFPVKVNTDTWIPDMKGAHDFMSDQLFGSCISTNRRLSTCSYHIKEVFMGREQQAEYFICIACGNTPVEEGMDRQEDV